MRLLFRQRLSRWYQTFYKASKADGLIIEHCPDATFSESSDTAGHSMSYKKKVFQDPLYFITFGFGSGLMPKAPGTFGTIAGIFVYLLLANLSWMAYIVVTLLAFIAGVVMCDKVSRQMGEHDYPGIVWDEVVGYLFTMFLVPVHFGWMMVGFVLFRVFDIWKPAPIRWCDKHVGGGFGIMLDDVVAAIFAWAILQLLVLGFRI